MGHGHGHGHTAEGDRRRLAIALAVTVGATVLGAVGAAITGSLALLADLTHLLTDGAALAAALVASLLAARPANLRRTFGLGRVEVLVAGVNAAALLCIVGWIAYEAVGRLYEPVAVPGLPMLIVGLLGLLANVVSLLVLSGGDRRNMNMRGAALHVLGDALGSAGVLLAAVVLMVTGWSYADTLASLFIVLLILPRAIALLREVTHVLLEGAPQDIDVAEVRETLTGIPGVAEVHDLHVWAINDRKPALSAHLVVDDVAMAGCGDESVLDQAATVLRQRWGIDHSTLQVEHPEHTAHDSGCR